MRSLKHAIALMSMLGCAYPSMAQYVRDSGHMRPLTSESIDTGAYTADPFSQSWPKEDERELLEDLFSGRLLNNVHPMSDTDQRGYDALVFGWETGEEEIDTRRRQDAINAFGKDWVHIYERWSSRSNRQDMAGRSLLIHFSDTQVGYFNDSLRNFCEKTGATNVTNAAEAWEFYAASRRAQVGAEEEKKVMRARQEREQRESRKMKKVITGICLTVVGVISLTLLIKVIRKAMRSELSRERQLIVWAALISITLLLIALIGGSSRFMWDNYDLPEGYYTMLRLGVTATGIYMTYIASKQKEHILILLLSAALSLLFQPLILISFKHATWLWIDLVVIPIIILITVQLTRHKEEQK